MQTRVGQVRPATVGTHPTASARIELHDKLGFELLAAPASDTATRFSADSAIA